MNKKLKFPTQLLLNTFWVAVECHFVFSRSIQKFV